MVLFRISILVTRPKCVTMTPKQNDKVQNRWKGTIYSKKKETLAQKFANKIMVISLLITPELIFLATTAG